MPETAQPTGFFSVVNDALGTIAKGAESYYDVRAARNETTVSPAPATKTPPGTTPGTTSPEAAAAANGDRGPVATVGLSTQQTVLIVAGAAAAIGLVWMLARKK